MNTPNGTRLSQIREVFTWTRPRRNVWSAVPYPAKRPVHVTNRPGSWALGEQFVAWLTA